MKSFFYCFIFLYLALGAYSQSLLKFDKSTFHEMGLEGDTLSWKISSEGLQSTNQQANSSFYFSAPVVQSTHNEYKIKLNLNFSTSSLNYVDVWLSASQSNLNNANGYFVRIGNTSDEVSLYKKSGSSIVKIIDGIDGRSQISSSNNEIVLKVSNIPSIGWELSDSVNTSGFVNEGKSSDTLTVGGNYWGVLVKQSTSSFFGKHTIKYLQQNFYQQDTIAPQLKSYFLTGNQLYLIFDEEIKNLDLKDIQAKNVTINSLNVKSDTLFFTLDKVTNPLKDTLIISNLSDIKGNRKNLTVPIEWYISQKNDVLLSEIFPDPTPSIGLPEAEFVEIYNKSNYSINIKGWKVCDANSCSTLPNYDLKAKSYLIICNDSDVGQFAGKEVVGVSLVSLNNAEDSIYLYDQNGDLQEKLFYNLSTYQDDDKKNGGYTLERIDATNFCAGSLNWKASADSKGGTPGSVNSQSNLWKPISNTIISKAYFNDYQLVLVPNSPLDLDKSFYGNWLKEFEYQNGLLIKDTSLKSSDSPLGLHLDSIPFCGVEELVNCDISAWKVSNENVKVYFNEILFNPYSGASDFVELYNNSDQAVDLSGFILSNNQSTSVSLPANLILEPKAYLAISQDVNSVKKYYKTGDNVLEIAKLPSMNDDEGTIYLSDNNGKQVDFFAYSSKMHLPELKNKEGVSLEKSNSNVPSSEAVWVSAATQVLATPALPNSQNQETTANSDFEVNPKIITPNADGYKDVMYITIQPNELNTLGNVRVFDLHGNLVKTVLSNQLIASHTTLVWDGSNDSNQVLSPAQYLMFVELTYTQSGEKKQYKVPVGIWE